MTPYYNFSEALQMLILGTAFTREGWNGKHSIRLQKPDENSKMTLPYIYITTDKGDVVPWIASQSDILATDWLIVN